jgi:CheY-like chemotaxis protein
MKKILMVDDDQLTLVTLHRVFKKEFEVYMCLSAEEFYEKYFGVEFDVIIMDISLRGGKDGLTLTKELKNSKKYSSIPILCLSAHAGNKDRENAFAAGVDLFLTKPVSNKILMESILTLLTK